MLTISHISISALNIKRARLRFLTLLGLKFHRRSWVLWYLRRGTERIAAELSESASRNSFSISRLSKRVVEPRGFEWCIIQGILHARIPAENRGVLRDRQMARIDPKRKFRFVHRPTAKLGTPLRNITT